MDLLWDYRQLTSTEVPITYEIQSILKEHKCGNGVSLDAKNTWCHNKKPLAEGTLNEATMIRRK